MPYIEQNRREQLNNEEGSDPEIPGELNYLITGICLWYRDRQGISYSTYNEIIGVLECAKLEFYRRAVAEYEDSKIIANGDVYD